MGGGERPSREEMKELLHRGYRYALSLSHDRSQAEDLVQDAWLSLLGKDDRYHVGYLFTTIRNRFIDQSRRRLVFDTEPLDDSAWREPSEFAADEQKIQAERATLGQALSRLRADEREALYLFAVEGYRLGEIAGLTGRPEGTISSLITRARQKIRQTFGAVTLRAVK